MQSSFKLTLLFALASFAVSALGGAVRIIPACPVCEFTDDKSAIDCGVVYYNSEPDYHFRSTHIDASASDITDAGLIRHYQMTEVVDENGKKVIKNSGKPFFAQFGATSLRRFDSVRKFSDEGKGPAMFINNPTEHIVRFIVTSKTGRLYSYTVKPKSNCGDKLLGGMDAKDLVKAVAFNAEIYE